MPSTTTLIWTQAGMAAEYWETEWLHYLFSNPAELTDPTLTTFQPRVVLITSRLDDPFQRYCRQYAERGLKYGIVLLSDEWLKYDRPGYYPASATFIFRNCYTPTFLGTNVKFFPLGVKQQFWQGYTGPTPDKITKRPLLWSFAGFTKKADRELMIYHMTKAFGQGKVVTTSGWNAADCLSTAAYRDLMLQTTFIPSPGGNVAVECFRTWEALEAGCIPIVPRVSIQNIDHHYAQLVEACGFTPPPFLEIDDWDDVEKNAATWQDDVKRLQSSCYKWWQKFKIHNRDRFTAEVAKWDTA